MSFGEQPIHHLAAHHSESNESEIGHSLPSPQEADFERAASSPAGALRESSRTCRKWAFIGSRGRERGDFRLQDLANLHQIARSFRLANLDHTVERLADGIGGSVGDKGSAAGIGFYQALFSQGLHCFADRSAAYPKLLS